MNKDGNCNSCPMGCDFTYHQHYDFIKEEVTYDQWVDDIQYKQVTKNKENMVRLKEQLDRGIKAEEEVL